MKDSDIIEDMSNEETQILPVIEDSKKLKNPILSVFMNVCSRELKKFMVQWRLSSISQRRHIVKVERKYLAKMKGEEDLEIETKVKTGVYIKLGK